MSERETFRLDRRSALRAAAVAGVGVPLLAACGEGAGASGTGGTRTTSTGPIAKVSEIPVGSGKIFEAEKVVITQPTEGDFKAFSAVCTHQGCLVESSSDGEIPCPCHLSHFSLEDGSPISGPASAPLAPVEITVDGDSITQA
jgi:Rieske Fe-S protein